MYFCLFFALIACADAQASTVRPTTKQCQPSIAHDFAARDGARAGKIASARMPDYSSRRRN